MKKIRLLFLLTLVLFGFSNSIYSSVYDTKGVGDTLVISEIMYNPPEGGTDSLEFVEIYNYSNYPRDISGFEIGYKTSGSNIVPSGTIIAPNSFYVISTDSAAFGGFYGFEANLYFTATSGLGNGGGSVWIKDLTGALLDSVYFDDNSAWPDGADGDGNSLILCDPTTDNGLGASWNDCSIFVDTNASGDSVWASPGVLNNCGGIVNLYSDIAVSLPGTTPANYYFCEANLSTVDVEMINAGTENIGIGDTVLYSVYPYGFPAPIIDTIILTNIWNTGSTLTHTFSYSFVGTTPGTYPISSWVTLVSGNDTVQTNDTSNSNFIVMNIIVDLGPDSVDLTTPGLPYSLDAGNAGVGASYLWNTGATTQTISATNLGVYYVTVTSPNDLNGLNCNDTDSITLYMLGCVDPYNITISGIGSDSANVNWTAGGTETEWSVEYGNAGFTQGSGNTAQVLTNPAYTVLGLSSMTSYDIYVRAVCAVGDSSNWVGPIQFTTGIPYYTDSLVITEIMYNPPEGGTDSLEFVEIYNNSMYANDISAYEIGYKTSTPHTINAGTIIAPFSYYIISTDSAAFGGFYGFEADLDWVGAYGLSNSGGSVWIKDAAGIVIDTVAYDDGGAWPNEADGSGNSLILCDYNSDNNDVANWGISRVYVNTNTASAAIYASPALLNDCSYDDIAVSIPGTTPADYYFCESNLNTVDVEMINLGSDDINIGDTVLYSVTIAGIPVVMTDTIVLSNVWTMGSTLQHTFSTSLTGTPVGTYAVQSWINLLNGMDIDNSNDTANCNFVIININVDLGPDSMDLITAGLPYTLDAGNAGIGATYLWSTAETTQTISATTLGTYSVTVTSPIDLNGNTCSDNDDIVLYSTSSLEENDININIFPNPTNNMVNIEIESYNEDIILEIVNLNGQIIVSDQLKSNQRQVSYDLSIFPAGVYTVVVRNNSFVKTSKLVKQ